jgi:phospholipase/carboxylesterase
MEFVEWGHSEDVIVLFHGYGADMHDLQNMASAVPGGDRFRWVFPNGIKQVELGPHFYGRAWYPIRIAEFEKAVREGRGILERQRPPGLDEALEQTESFVQSLGIKDENLILGGFSQGAMLAVELLARGSRNVKAALLLSGNLMDAENLKKLASRHEGQRFYQSHGTHDPILPYAGALSLEKLLTECGWTGSLDSFRGGHEIPLSVIQNLGHFLSTSAT